MTKHPAIITPANIYTALGLTEEFDKKVKIKTGTPQQMIISNEHEPHGHGHLSDSDYFILR